MLDSVWYYIQLEITYTYGVDQKDIRDFVFQQNITVIFRGLHWKQSLKSFLFARSYPNKQIKTYADYIFHNNPQQFNLCAFLCVKLQHVSIYSWKMFQGPWLIMLSSNSTLELFLEYQKMAVLQIFQLISDLYNV